MDEHFANEHAPDLLGMAMFHLEKPSLRKIIRSLKWLLDLTLLGPVLIEKKKSILTTDSNVINGKKPPYPLFFFLSNK